MQSVVFRWVDFSFYGHQIVAHVVDGYNAESSCNAVDGDPVPIPHFGLAMSQADFHALAKRLQQANIKFELKPHVRFQGQPGTFLFSRCHDCCDSPLMRFCLDLTYPDR